MWTLLKDYLNNKGNIMRKVLVVEDDNDIARLIKIHLQDINCDVTLVADGLKGMKKSELVEFDMYILDIMLPGIDGLEICRRLRAKSNHNPILMLTAKTAELDRVLGLEIGADDYITKPFSIRELQARVKALFRRSNIFLKQECNEPSGQVRHKNLIVNFKKRKTTLAGKIIHLTAKEYDLLKLLIQNPGRTYSRSELLDLVWDYNYQGYQHTVNSHINRLRAKIEKDPANPEYILTAFGIGYQFTDE